MGDNVILPSRDGGPATPIASRGRPSLERAAEIGNPSYAIDDETAIRGVDGAVDLVSEGNWRRFD